METEGHAGAYAALADENRLRIVGLLAGGEKCVCEIAEHLGASDALTSHHLRRLRDAGLVRARKVGPWLHCSLAPEAFERVAAAAADLAARARSAGERGCCGLPGARR